MNERQIKILRYLDSHATGTSKDLAKAAGINAKSIHRDINPLIKDGYIVKSDNPRDKRSVNYYIKIKTDAIDKLEKGLPVITSKQLERKKETSIPKKTLTKKEFIAKAEEELRRLVALEKLSLSEEDKKLVASLKEQLKPEKPKKKDTLPREVLMKMPLKELQQLKGTYDTELERLRQLPNPEAHIKTIRVVVGKLTRIDKVYEERRKELQKETVKKAEIEKETIEATFHEKVKKTKPKAKLTPMELEVEKALNKAEYQELPFSYFENNKEAAARFLRFLINASISGSNRKSLVSKYGSIANVRAYMDSLIDILKS